MTFEIELISNTQVQKPPKGSELREFIRVGVISYALRENILKTVVDTTVV